MIRRDPADTAARAHDLIVIGGGIHGACVALEAARRGLRPLLLERKDFGGATSWNSLRLLHGGLRYLQTLDLQRHRDSVAEQEWFCRTFPDLVRPQPCLMPLYGQGLKRPSVFRAALRLDDLLSRARGNGAAQTHYLGRGRVLTAQETIALLPQLDGRGLRGAGLWYDGAMTSPPRLLIEILRWACSAGATALNYVEALDLVENEGRVEGVVAHDRVAGRTLTFSSPWVCNCAGPWAPATAAVLDRDMPRLFPLSLAFNVLLDREPPAPFGLAVTPRRTPGPTYFMYPALGGLLAGTAHVPWTAGPDDATPREEHLEHLLVDLNASVPGLDARREHVRRVFAGLLPAAAPGTARLAVRPTIVDHARHGGPRGLVSVAGVKFTTARLVAERVLGSVERFARRRPSDRPGRPAPISGIDFGTPPPDPFTPASVSAIRRIADEEAVMTVDDLLFRRSDWGLVDDDVDALRARTLEAIGWAARVPA